MNVKIDKLSNEIKRISERNDAKINKLSDQLTQLIINQRKGG